MRRYCRLPGISHKDYITNAGVRNRITHALGPQEDLPTTPKRRKLKWYGYHQDLPKHSYKEPCKGIEGEDRERDWGKGAE